MHLGSPPDDGYDHHHAKIKNNSEKERQWSLHLLLGQSRKCVLDLFEEFKLFHRRLDKGAPPRYLGIAPQDIEEGPTVNRASPIYTPILPNISSIVQT